MDKITLYELFRNADWITQARRRIAMQEASVHNLLPLKGMTPAQLAGLNKALYHLEQADKALDL